MTTRNQQVARIDYEGDAEIERQRSRRRSSHGVVEHALAPADAVLVSDYLKGVISRRRRPRLRRRKRRGAASVLVDPKVPHIDYYAGADGDHAEPS